MLETWVSDLKDSFAVEKEHLLGRIAELEVTQRKASHTRMSLETSHTRTPGESEVSNSDMVGRGGDDRTEALNSSGVTDGLENGMSRHMVEVTESLDTGNVTDSFTGHVSGSGILEIGMSGVSCVEPTSSRVMGGPSAETGVLHSGMGVSVSGVEFTHEAVVSTQEAAVTVTAGRLSNAVERIMAVSTLGVMGHLVASTETTSVVSGTRMATGVTATSAAAVAATESPHSRTLVACEPRVVVDHAGPHDVVRAMTTLLQAQADAMAAQARASVVQNLPAILCFTGEEKDVMEDGFERWIERFEERVQVAGWRSEQKLYQLKLHLEGTAREVLRMLPEVDKTSYDRAVTALKKRFKPLDIEELRGLEFHHLMETKEMVQQLGIEIQRLGRKAFPSMIRKEFDRLLKGRFYHALLVKWQRKLGPPKTSESFYELYDRARALEEQERQYVVSAGAHQVKSDKRVGSRK